MLLFNCEELSWYRGRVRKAPQRAGALQPSSIDGLRCHAGLSWRMRQDPRGKGAVPGQRGGRVPSAYAIRGSPGGAWGDSSACATSLIERRGLMFRDAVE